MRRSGIAWIAAWLLLACWPAADAGAASPFAWRGIVEGPYGTPWSASARTRMLTWMERHGLNAYVHAPKDDLYQRTLWREPYPQAEQRQFDREIAAARSRGLDWIPNLSPALPLIPTPALPGTTPSVPLCFSCPGDLDGLLDKLEPFRRAGARTFMVSFDDVIKVFVHPEDVIAYGVGDEAYGRANADFLNRLYVALRDRRPGARLLTVGADYSGVADTDYLRGLRAHLRPQVEVMWTGTNVPAENFTAADARAYAERIGRRPIVWDNWTNDDSSGNAVPVGTARIFLGPYRRRAELAGEVRGFFLNPANEADLNVLPLATAADWLRDPAGYARRSSWLTSVAELAPGGGASARRLRRTLRAWAETSYSTKLDPRDAPTFVRRAEALLAAYGGARWTGAHRGLVHELALVEAAPDVLGALPNHRFIAQAAPWLAGARQSARAGHLGAKLLAAERPALRVHRAAGGFAGRALPPDPARATVLRTKFAVAKAQTKAQPRMTYGWRGGVGFDIPPYAAPDNVMDVWFDEVDALDQAWTPTQAQAAGGVTLRLGRHEVPLDPKGRFTLGRSACHGLLVATDGAGGGTAARVPACA